MSKKRIWIHTVSIAFLTAPNMIYLGCNFDILKEANTIALTMTAMLVLSIVGLGSLAHFKANSGVWVTVIGIFILSLSNIAWIAGMALLIEGGGLLVDGYLFRPWIEEIKLKELEESGRKITYTREIK